MSKTQILLDELSPNGNLSAIVEDDSRSVYFYLHGAPETEFGVRSCWVRNRRPAPANLDVKAMRRGNQPMLPAQFCRHPEGALPLRPDRLTVVWFEEGDAAALLEDAEILAVIPGWSGLNGFAGYARDCTADNPVCWPLGTPDSNVLFDRVAESQEFWSSWDNGDPWPTIQDGIVRALENSIAPYTKYYAIDNGVWPPKAILKMAFEGAIVAVTCGVSIRPQPHCDRNGDYAKWRRVELGIAIDASFAGDAEVILRYLSAQSNMPWYFYNPLGAGHTIPCDGMPASPSGIKFTSVLLTENPAGAPAVALPSYRGDPVTILWMIPITEAERALAVQAGSAELERRLRESGVGWVHRNRDPVV